MGDIRFVLLIGIVKEHFLGNTKPELEKQMGMKHQNENEWDIQEENDYTQFIL